MVSNIGSTLWLSPLDVALKLDQPLTINFDQLYSNETLRPVMFLANFRRVDELINKVKDAPDGSVIS